MEDDYGVVEVTETEAPPSWGNETSDQLELELELELVNKVVTSIPFLYLGLGIIIVTVFGLLGNFVSALVLTRKRLQSSYSVLTLGLTFVDSVYLITKFLRYGIASLFVHYQIASDYTYDLLPHAGPYLRAITFTAHTASTYFTIAIALDRYLAVCWPAKARTYCTRKTAHLISFLVILWSFAFNATRWLEMETVELDELGIMEDEELAKLDNFTLPRGRIYSMNPTDLRKDPVYKEAYIFWAYLFIMFIIPFVTLSVLNLCILLGIRRMLKNSSMLTSTQKRDTSFSIMLIGVVLVFLLCNLDYLILDILDYCGIAFSEFWNHLGNFLLTINSAVNFIIYCVCGWKFRQELWKLIRDICPCLKQHGSHDIAVTDECQWVKDTMNNMDMQTIPRVSLSKATSKNHM